MRKDWIRTSIALLILVGLTLFVSWNRKKNFQKNEKADVEAKLVSLDFETVDRIKVQNGQGTVWLHRRPKDAGGAFTDAFAPLSIEFSNLADWAVMSPYQGVADSGVMGSFIANVKGLKSEKLIDEKGERLEEYNLKNPPLSIELFKKDAEVPALSIRVGDENSAKSGYYIQTSENPRIVLADRSLSNVIDKKPFDWRMKEIIGFSDVRDIKSVKATYNEGGKKSEVHLKKEGENWKLVDGADLPAETDTVERFLRDIKGVRLTDIVSGDFKTDLRKYGFVPPLASIEYEFTHKDEAHKRLLLLGGKSGDGDQIYAARGDSGTIFSVRANTHELLIKSAKDFIKLKPMDLDPEKVTSLSLIHRGVRQTLAKENGGWLLSEPVKDRADSEELSAFLQNLTNLKAEAYLGKTKPSGFGSEELKVTMAAGEATRNLIFSPVKDTSDVLAIWQEQGMAYRFTRDAYSQIVTQLDQLRDRKLTDKEEDELSSVFVTKKTNEVLLQNGEEGSWKVAKVQGWEEGVSKKLKSQGTANSIAAAIFRVRLEAFADDKKPADMGDPWLRLEFRPKEGNISVWSVGGKDDKHRWIWSEQRNLVAKVPGSQIEEIESFLKADQGDGGS